MCSPETLDGIFETQAAQIRPKPMLGGDAFLLSPILWFSASSILFLSITQLMYPTCNGSYY